MPTPVQLYKQKCGCQSTKSIFLQEASSDTCLHLILKSGFVSSQDKNKLFECTNPLLAHLDQIRQKLANYDFCWFQEKDLNWHKQKHNCGETSMARITCLLHYGLNISLLVQYIGGKYVAAHHDIDKIIKKIRLHVDDPLIPHFVRVMTCGCPRVFNAESLWANLVKYWRASNNPSINKNINIVMTTACKEVNNKFTITLSFSLNHR